MSADTSGYTRKLLVLSTKYRIRFHVWCIQRIAHRLTAAELHELGMEPAEPVKEQETEL